MKKHSKIKLSLNSQTVRRLATPVLKEVQGGLRQIDDSVAYCLSDACRGCG